MSEPEPSKEPKKDPNKSNEPLIYIGLLLLALLVLMVLQPLLRDFLR